MTTLQVAPGELLATASGRHGFAACPRTTAESIPSGALPFGLELRSQLHFKPQIRRSAANGFQFPGISAD
jgi:hypothetical protein